MTVDLSLGAIVSDEIATKGANIMYAEKSEPVEIADSGWQFLSAATSSFDVDGAKLWTLADVIKRDPSLIPFLELGIGVRLTRNKRSGKWITFGY